MEKRKCVQCGKVLEGYSRDHVEYLLAQHQLKHWREKKKNEIHNTQPSN